MPPEIHDVLVAVTRALEIVGAATLIAGFLIASVQCLLRIRTAGAAAAYHRYRQALGRVVLIGLEILVAATILKTVTLEPTPESLGLLALMIAIRTFLGWSTTLELEGRWPWQRKAPEPVESDPA